jgi:hypothetical protein
MRVVLILAILVAIAIIFHIVWLGSLVFYFIAGCALFGVGETIKDGLTGGWSMQAQMRRHLSKLPPNFNPRYGSLRLRGLSHDECIRCGESPTRPDDYFEKLMSREDAIQKLNRGGLSR